MSCRAGESFLVDRIGALWEKDTSDGEEVPLPLLHRTLACAQSGESSERVRRTAVDLVRKIVADLNAGDKELPLTLLPLLADVDIEKPGAVRCVPPADLSCLFP